MHTTKKQKGDGYMVEKDTIKLLRECDAGVKMGVSSIEEVLPHVGSHRLEGVLTRSKQEHERLDGDLQQMLSLQFTS